MLGGSIARSGRRRGDAARPRGAPRVLGRRRAGRPVVLGDPVAEPGDVLPDDAGHQRRPAGSGHHRPGSARRDVDHAGGVVLDARRVAAGGEARLAALPDLGDRPASAQGLLPLLPTAAGPITGCPCPASCSERRPGDHLEIAPGVESPRRSGTRISTDAEDMVLLHHYTPLMAEAVARFGSDEWVELAGEIGVPVQPVRAPEEALLDPLLVADGCVAEVVDPQTRRRPPGRAGLPARRLPQSAREGRRPGSASTPTRCWSAATSGIAGRPPRAGPASGRTARRHRRARPRPGRRRSLRHPAAGRSGGHRDQGERPPRRLLDEQPHRHVLQPGQAQRGHQPEGTRRARHPPPAGRPGPTSSSTTCATTRPNGSASTTRAFGPSIRLSSTATPAASRKGPRASAAGQ